MGNVWPSSRLLLGQVEGVAREIFRTRAAAAEDFFWGSFADNEVMRSLMDDEGSLDVSQLI